MRRLKPGWLWLVPGMALAVAALAYAAPGDLDPSFGTHGKTFVGFGNASSDMAVQADGATIVAGSDFIARLTAAGEVDEAFGDDGQVPDPFGDGSGDPYSVALETDGGIVVGGQVTATNPTDGVAVVARYLPDGTLDKSFSGDGVVTLAKIDGVDMELVSDVAIQPDGKIIVAGFNDPDSGFIARFNTDGSFDTGLSGDGVVISKFGFRIGYLFAVAPGPGGSIYAGGTAYGANDDQDMLVVRVDSTGTPDPGFSGDGIATVEFNRDEDEVAKLLVQPDGNLLAAGNSSAESPSKSKAAFARFTPAGALDAAFGGDGTVTTSKIGSTQGLELGPSGTIYAAGGFVSVIRMLANGDLDKSFSEDGDAEIELGPFSEGAEALAVAPDGRLMVSASSFVSKDDIVIGIARLLAAPGPADADADGVLDEDDECDDFADPDNDGCPLIERRLTLSERKGFFHGNVLASTSSDGIVFSVELNDCKFDGKVAVYRVKRGPDKLIGKAPSRSSWNVEERVGNHRYYARLKEHLRPGFALCGGAKSKILRG